MFLFLPRKTALTLMEYISPNQQMSLFLTVRSEQVFSVLNNSLYGKGYVVHVKDLK